MDVVPDLVTKSVVLYITVITPIPKLAIARKGLMIMHLYEFGSCLYPARGASRPTTCGGKTPSVCKFFFFFLFPLLGPDTE
jgi:hypothetical protein